MDTLAVIPARGSSKGISRKNLRELGGKPLVAWTIEAAREAETVDRVLVSTDDADVSELARNCGADWVRVTGPNLHRDNCLSRYIDLDALEWAFNRHNYDPDALVRLHPTSPLRKATHIDEAYRAWSKRGAMVSVCEAPKHPSLLYRRSASGRLSQYDDSSRLQPRQDKPPVYAVNGALYWARTRYWRTHYGFFGPRTDGYVMDQRASVDIDTETDWQIAEALMGSANPNRESVA